MMNNNINGMPRKKNNGNYRNNIGIDEDCDENEYEELEENEAYKDNNNNYNENNENNRNNMENPKKIIHNNLIIENPRNLQEYFLNHNFQKPRIEGDINNYNAYNDSYNQTYGYGINNNEIDYILSQLVNNLSSNVNAFDLNPNEPILSKINKRKNTLESYGDESFMGQVNNNNQTNNFGLKCNVKSRKNSEISVNKNTQNEKNEFDDFCKKMMVGFDEQNSYNNELKNPIEEEFSMNLLKNIK